LLANPSDLSLKSAVTLNEASFNVASKVAPSSDQLLWLTSMIARGPPSHFTAPVERGLVFAIDHPSQIASAQKYNSYTAADFDALMASEKDADASDPIGFFDLSQSSRTPVPSSDGVRCALFRMSRFRPSRFLLVKLIQTKVDENVDINYLGFIQDRDELSDLEFSSEPVKLSRAASSASQTDSSHMLINMVSGQVSSTEYRIAPATSREVAVRQHPNNHIKMDDGAGLIVTLPAFDNSSAGWSITMQVGITALVPLFPVTLFSVQPIELPIDSQSLLSLTVVDEDNEVGPVFSLVAGNHDSEIVSKSVIEIDTDLDLCDGVARTFVITVSDNRISVYLSNEVILELELTSNSQMFQSAKNGFRAVVGARLQGTLSNVAYWAEPLSEVKSLGLDAVATEFQSRQKVDSRIQLLKFVGHGNHQVESHGAVPVSYMTMDQLKQILSASSGDVVSDSVQSSHSAALALLSNSSRARVRVLLKPLAASSTQTSSHRSVSRFTLIMDVLMTEFPHSSAESVCLFCPQANDVPSSSLCVSKSGRLELLGVRSDVKMQTHKWHRIAMIVDARGQSALVYLDGKLAMTVNSASAVRRQRIPLLSFEQLSLGSHFGLGGGQTEQSSELTVGLYVRAVQLSNVLKSEAEIVELFQLDNQTGQYLDFAESRPEAEKCRMLTALGWNLRWASLAMNACGNSLAASNRWLRQHQELLKLEDESIKVRALAQRYICCGVVIICNFYN
jgi:hypothetical protein